MEQARQRHSNLRGVGQGQNFSFTFTRFATSNYQTGYVGGKGTVTGPITLGSGGSESRSKYSDDSALHVYVAEHPYIPTVGDTDGG